MEEVKYYAKLLNPYKNKYGEVTSIDKKIKVSNKPVKWIREFYASFGNDAIHEGFMTHLAKYNEDFTQLDYVMKHKEIIMQYGHGSAEFESVPCRLFKEVIKSEKTITEL